MKVIQIIKNDNTTKSSNDVLRVAAYARVSTSSLSQEESFTSQIDYYNNLFTNNPKYKLIKVYGDIGITGLNANKRPEFMQMINDAINKKFDIIFVKSISRFARCATDCIKYIDILNNVNVIVYFEKENIYSNDKNLKIILELLASLAQEESNSISQNIRWSYKKNASIGNPTRKTCYGYTKVITNEKMKIHNWIINNSEAERIKLIYNLAASNIKINTIKNILNDYEIKNNSTYLWTKPKIKYILHNEAYIGNIVTHKRIIPDYVSKKIIINKNMYEQVIILDHHEPIIDKDLFNKINLKEMYK